VRKNYNGGIMSHTIPWRVLKYRKRGVRNEIFSNGVYHSKLSMKEIVGMKV
jgi:hypothetical protein